MIRNYIKIAIRHLWKNRLFSAPNLVGLNLGLASIMTLVFEVYAYYSAHDALKGRKALYSLHRWDPIIKSSDGESG